MHYSEPKDSLKKYIFRLNKGIYIPVGKIAEKAVYVWQYGTVVWVPN